MTPSNAVNYRFTVRTTECRPENLLHILDLALEETKIHFSEARIKLETSYKVQPKTNALTIEGGTPVGEHLAEAIAGLLRKKFGAEAYTVQRLAPRQKTRENGA